MTDLPVGLGHISDLQPGMYEGSGTHGSHDPSAGKS